MTLPNPSEFPSYILSCIAGMFLGISLHIAYVKDTAEVKYVIIKESQIEKS